MLPSKALSHLNKLLLTELLSLFPLVVQFSVLMLYINYQIFCSQTMISLTGDAAVKCLGCKVWGHNFSLQHNVSVYMSTHSFVYLFFFQSPSNY